MFPLATCKAFNFATSSMTLVIFWVFKIIAILVV